MSRFKTGALSNRVYHCRRQTTQKTDEFAFNFCVNLGKDVTDQSARQNGIISQTAVLTKC